MSVVSTNSKVGANEELPMDKMIKVLAWYAAISVTANILLAVGAVLHLVKFNLLSGVLTGVFDILLVALVTWVGLRIRRRG